MSFTGSTRAGKRVSVVAADTVERVALELGGKSANIVLESADLAKAVKVGLGAAWQDSGQTCTAWTRMLVARGEAVRDRRAAGRGGGEATVGDPTDASTRIGPMSSETQRQRVTS
ncbi:aldehyde dehydrogenase family protein [Pseudonocardia halophobica]|uniref:aldehyde dehydrogenase family protein n=1 Tax=Pseudonocardia halophobica TaxID=29401 RepID=UPI003D9241D5